MKVIVHLFSTISLSNENNHQNLAISLSLSLLSLQIVHADSRTLEQNFKQNYPDIPITSITPSPLSGIYEVYVSGKIIYTDENAKYLFLAIYSM